MKASHLLLFLFLTSCDSLEPEARGEHQSTATVQLNPSLLLPRSNRFLPNQIALLTTGTILNPASKECGVEPEIISSILEIKQVNDSDLITISTTHDDKNQSQLIIEALLNSYLTHRTQQETTLAEGKLKALDHELAIQNDLVKKNREALTHLIGNYGIPYFDGNDSGPLGATEERMLVKDRQKLANFKTQQDQNAIEIRKIKELKGLELAEYGAGLDLPENQVSVHYDRHRKALKKEAALVDRKLRANHPDRIATKKMATEALEDPPSVLHHPQLDSSVARASRLCSPKKGSLQSALSGLNLSTKIQPQISED